MRKEQLVFSHAACSYHKWVWLQVNFEGAIFAGRKKSAKKTRNLSASKIKRYTVNMHGIHAHTQVAIHGKYTLACAGIHTQVYTGICSRHTQVYTGICSRHTQVYTGICSRHMHSIHGHTQVYTAGLLNGHKILSRYVKNYYVIKYKTNDPGRQEHRL